MKPLKPFDIFGIVGTLLGISGLLYLSVIAPWLAQRSYEVQAARVQIWGDATATPSGKPNYGCLIEAWQDIGPAALPQPLPSTVGHLGERAYKVGLDGREIPVRVFSLGMLSLAPGEHTAQDLTDLGYADGFTFEDQKFPADGLIGIDIWIFNEGHGLTVEEGIRLAKVFPVFYQTGEQGVPVFGLLPYGGKTEGEARSAFDAFATRQKTQLDAIWASWETALTAGLEEAAREPGLCGAYAASIWSRRLTRAQALHEAGAPSLLGGLFVHQRENARAWRAIILVHVDESTVTNAVGASLVTAESHLGATLSGSGDVAIEYPITNAGGLPLSFHELSHGPCGGGQIGEECADRGSESLTRQTASRFSWADFRGTLVVVNFATGKTSEINLPTRP